MALHQPEGCLYLVHIVQFLPGEELDLNVFVAFVAAAEVLHHRLRLAAHVAVGGRLLVDGVAQLQALLDGAGTKVEQLAYLAGNLAVAHGHVAAPVGVDVDADGLRHADGIAHLHQYFVGHAGSHQVLGNVPGG